MHAFDELALLWRLLCYNISASLFLEVYSMGMGLICLIGLPPVSHPAVVSDH